MTDSPHEEGSPARDKQSIGRKMPSPPAPLPKGEGRFLQADADLAAAARDEQYRTRLCRLVEREMSRRFRRQEDPEDVVQSAFRTFYRRSALGEFPIDSSADLWCLLATLTRHKLLKHVEKLDAGKRDPRREEYPAGDALQGRNPTPEEAAIAADLVEKSLAGLDEIYVQVLHLRLQNCTEEEIAAALGCNRGRVRARLNHLRERLRRLSDDDGTPTELDALLRQCLAAPASEYLQGLGASEELATVVMPLGELFRCPDPPLALLIAVKRHSRRLMSPGAADRGNDLPVRLPAAVHRLVYFASIAAALVRLGRRISKSSPEILRAAWERLAAESYPDAGQRKLFAAARERLSK